MKSQLLLAIFVALMFGSPVRASQPEIAIIIDDLGTNWPKAEKVLELPKEVTASILPFTPHAKKIAKRAAEQGRSIMLHVPMEAHERNELLGPGALRSSMAGWQLLTQLRKDIVSLPNVVGVNNHMGSRLTQETGNMRWVMALLKWQGLYFIDSRTTVETVAQQVAGSMGVATSGRDIFLDHHISEKAIDKQFERLLAFARKNGSAIAIGHPHSETIRVLKKRLPQLAAEGIKLVTPATIIKDRELQQIKGEQNRRLSSADAASGINQLKEILSKIF